MTKNIKPGYLLKVTTWENDGDNYNTVEHDGLTEEQVRFYIYVCKKFKSGNRPETPDSFGNKGIPQTRFHEDMKAYIAAYPSEVPADWVVPDDDADEYFYDELVGDLGINSTEYGYWRVFESAEVFLVPTAIENVTSQFK